MKLADYKNFPEPGEIKFSQMLALPTLIILVALALYFHP
jgi:hypothetical protein